MHEQMTNQCVNQLDDQVCMRISSGIGINESFAAYEHVFSLEVTVIWSQQVVWGIGWGGL